MTIYECISLVECFIWDERTRDTEGDIIVPIKQ